MKVLLHLVQKVPYLSEIEHDEELNLLRGIEKDLGLSGIVPPATGAMNEPAPVPVVDPGPVATAVPAAAQPIPPTSPEVSPMATPWT